MPLQIQDIIDLQTLVESEQVEFKLAGGKDGKGELPKDFWPTYSAMANGRGGWVNHERACQLTIKHPREVTLTLPRLESKGFLTAGGEQKSKHYTLPGVSVMTPDEVFSLGAINVSSSSTHNDENSTYSERRFTHSETGSTHNAGQSGGRTSGLNKKTNINQSISRDEHGCW